MSTPNFQDKLEPEQLRRAKIGLSYINEYGNYVPDQGFSENMWDTIYNPDGTRKLKESAHNNVIDKEQQGDK